MLLGEWSSMSRLSAKARAQLPDSAFAYVDSKGKRRLPIHDEAHVRNALGRFNQIKFEDDAARERARKKLLSAAKKHGIVPIGFITGQLATERLEGESRGRDTSSKNLPTGVVTFFLTDIEDSTGLVRRVGDGYGALLADVRRLLRRAVGRAGGMEVDARADEFFAVFKRPADAVEAAIAVQRSLGSRVRPEATSVRVRIGLHTGRPTLNESGYMGLAVHTAARICTIGHGGQIVLSAAAARAVEASLPVGVGLRRLGDHMLQGLPEPVTLFQVESDGLSTRFPPLRVAESRARPPRARRSRG
jgi:class 3 adenylate cyclase